MELKDVIRKRHSVRSFKEESIPDIERLIELAKMSPSAGAIRGYKIILTKEKITSIKASLYLVICIDSEAYAKRYGDRGRNLYAVQDGTIFGAYLQLLLVDEGYSSVWIGAFNEDRIKKALGVELRPIAIIAMGKENVNGT